MGGWRSLGSAAAVTTCPACDEGLKRTRCRWGAVPSVAGLLNAQTCSVAQPVGGLHEPSPQVFAISSFLFRVAIPQVGGNNAPHLTLHLQGLMTGCGAEGGTRLPLFSPCPAQTQTRRRAAGREQSQQHFSRDETNVRLQRENLHLIG